MKSKNNNFYIDDYSIDEFNFHFTKNGIVGELIQDYFYIKTNIEKDWDESHYMINYPDSEFKHLIDFYRNLYFQGKSEIDKWLFFNNDARCFYTQYNHNYINFSYESMLEIIKKEYLQIYTKYIEWKSNFIREKKNIDLKNEIKLYNNTIQSYLNKGFKIENQD